MRPLPWRPSRFRQGRPLKPDASALDQARRQWLDGIARQYRLAPARDTALALARAEWLCGAYDEALRHFLEARQGTPSADADLGALRAASMMGETALEAELLQAALAAHPGHPDLRLHAALSSVPDDVAAARAWLAPLAGHPLGDDFAAALDAVQSGEAPASPPAPYHDLESQRRTARWDSLRWAIAHASTPTVHVGLPSRVLLRALAMAPAAGLTMECGVYFGRSLRMIAARTDGPVHGFDSFDGLPEAWSEREAAGTYSTGGRMPAMPAHVELHPGWFEDTLPPFFARHAGPVRLLHIDCDLYSSTRTVLEHAAARLVPGSVVVFDDLLGYPGYRDHELRALEEFTADAGIGWELVAACLMGREVAIRITGR